MADGYLAGRGNPWDYDPGPPRNRKWPRLFSETPNYRALGEAVMGYEKFRWHFGPMYYRGRLWDNQVKVLVIERHLLLTMAQPGRRWARFPDDRPE